jgi:16S rRNA (adenine1518-N6/adenine1519-N6)-dimethyltransferase
MIPQGFQKTDERMKVRPKKRLGQHFLTDADIAARTADSIPDDSAESLVEIGPGMGMLTQFLIPKNKKLFPVEIDDESVEYLEEHYPDLKDNIIYGDFLDFNLSEKFPEGLDLIGNFPYNISAPILFKVLEHRRVVRSVVGMFQKEVAQRIVASHGNKTYGILSVLIQTFYKAELLFTVGPEKFNPPPNVDSAVLRLQQIPDKTLKCDEAFFFKTVKTAFGMRRKMLRNSLKPILGEVVSDHPFMTLRPEQLSPEQFEELAVWLQDNTANISD